MSFVSDRILNRTAAWLMAFCGLAAAIASTATILADERFVFLATGLWALAIVLLPLAMDRDYDLFSMWTFVLLTVLIGVTLRGACLSFGYPDADRLDQLYLLGREPAYFFGPAVWLLVGLLMLTLGFVAIGFRARPLISPSAEPHAGRLVALGLVLLVVSAVATALYIQRTGGSALGDWSAKRTVIPDLDLEGAGYQSHGGLRFVASLAIFGHLLVLGQALSPSTSGKNRTLLWILAIALLLVACVVPFYASLRTTVAMNFAFSAAIVFYTGRRLRITVLLAMGIAVLLAVYLMTALRPTDHEVELATPTVGRVFQAAVINRNQIELPKTAHILHAIPDELPLQYGKTIARWALAPIPRSLWPDKPVIPPGPKIGNTVYHQRVAGVPPSLVAELFWNFHLPGVLIGAFGLGMLLRFLESRFRSPVGPGFLGAAVYIVGPMTMGFELVGGSIGSALFRAVLQTVVMAGLLILIRPNRVKSPSIPC
ncbi:MAG: hypothetical protein KDN20_13700 [Verrucomicrobiae bacterium]|nr:hypothetical protein [Verrucomicrobiae bacterium]